MLIWQDDLSIGGQATSSGSIGCLNDTASKIEDEHQRNSGSINVFRSYSKELLFLVSYDLAGEFIRPGQRGLIGERCHQDRGTCSKCRTLRKLHPMTQKRLHLLVLLDYLEGGLPPPCRRRRSITLGNCAPLRKLARDPLELKFCSRMHIALQFGNNDRQLGSLWLCAFLRHTRRVQPLPIAFVPKQWSRVAGSNMA
jgi:hypothetical protein